MQKIILTLLCSIVLYGCAQFVPPTGGPKDIQAPTLINSTPENKTKNFKGTTISLTFDELIEANALRQELIITPDPGNSFDIKIKNENVVISFDEPFQDSTTYTFNFRNGVKDLSEKNPAQNLKLVFSTGSEIDSMTLNGTVRNLLTNKKLEEVLVGLYEVKEDSIPYLKRKPSYFIKTDTTGTYSFENIRNVPFRLFAFTDKNQNLIFDSKSELIAFLPDTIKLDTVTSSIDLSLYPSNTSPPKLTRTLSKQQTVTLNFDKNIKDAQVTFLGTDTLNYKIDKSQFIFFNYPTAADTILTKLIVVDSSDNALELEPKIKFSELGKEKEYQPKSFNIRVENAKANTIIKYPKEYLIRFDEPIINLDEESITLTIDSINAIPLKFSWVDNSKTILKIEPQVNTKAEKLTLSIPSGSITNYKSDTNNTYTLINNVYPQGEYGKISGSFNEFSGQKIAELIDVRTQEVIESQLFTDKFQFEKLLPGNYIIRVIEDLNNNGQWDAGNFEDNLLPEKVFVSKGIIKLKANFELQDVKLN